MSEAIHSAASASAAEWASDSGEGVGQIPGGCRLPDRLFPHAWVFSSAAEFQAEGGFCAISRFAKTCARVRRNRPESRVGSGSDEVSIQKQDLRKRA